MVTPAPSAVSSAGSLGGAGAPGPRRLVSTSAVGAGAGEPAGDLRAERAGAAGDQHRAAAAHVRHRVARRGPDWTSRRAEHAACVAPATLVLAPARRARRRAGRRRDSSSAARQVDESAPALRLLQGDDPAQTPDRGLPVGLGVSARPVATAPLVSTTAGLESRRRPGPGRARRSRRRPAAREGAGAARTAPRRSAAARALPAVRSVRRVGQGGQRGVVRRDGRLAPGSRSAAVDAGAVRDRTGRHHQEPGTGQRGRRRGSAGVASRPGSVQASAARSFTRGGRHDASSGSDGRPGTPR